MSPTLSMKQEGDSQDSENGDFQDSVEDNSLDSEEDGSQDSVEDDSHDSVEDDSQDAEEKEMLRMAIAMSLEQEKGFGVELTDDQIIEYQRGM